MALKGRARWSEALSSAKQCSARGDERTQRQAPARIPSHPIISHPSVRRCTVQSTPIPTKHARGESRVGQDEDRVAVLRIVRDEAVAKGAAFQHETRTCETSHIGRDLADSVAGRPWPARCRRDRASLSGERRERARRAEGREDGKGTTGRALATFALAARPTTSAHLLSLSFLFPCLPRRTRPETCA